MESDQPTRISCANRLRERRIAVGITPAQIAERLGIDTARYRTWEKVFGPLPQRQYGDALARILGVDSAWLCSGVGEVDSPLVDYAFLGQRAATRRRVLKLTKAKVAEAVGISLLTLSKWEENLPAQSRGLKEAVWEDALMAPSGWLRDPSMECLDPPAPSSASLDLTSAGCDSVASEIRAVGVWLTRLPERSRTVHINDLSEGEQRRATMFADRYGVSGGENTILQVIGSQFGVTRERVRQVVNVMTARAHGVVFVLPHLLRLREAAGSSSVISVADFEAANRDLLGPSLSLADADCFAREILGISVASVTERSCAQAGNALKPMIGGEGGHGTAVVVRDASRRMIRSCGAAHVMFVTGMVSAALGSAVSVQDVRQALSAVEGMDWLTTDEDWYWFGMDTAQNRVLEVAKKALSVADQRLDIEDLQQAVCRSRRLLYEDRVSPPAIEVPKHVLREIYARVPWLTVVQCDDFVLTEPVPISEALNSSEMAVAGTIRRNGGAVARQVLHKEFVLSGRFSSPNLQIVLTNSPIIRPLGFGIYGLRGVPVTEKAFATAMAGVGSHVAQSSSAVDGWHEFEITITDFKLRRGIVDFPMSVTRAIPAGKYRADGFVVGNFGIGEVPSAPSRTTKFVALLRRSGVQAGDVLRIRINPQLLQAEISRVTADFGVVREHGVLLMEEGR